GMEGGSLGQVGSGARWASREAWAGALEQAWEEENGLRAGEERRELGLALRGLSAGVALACGPGSAAAEAGTRFAGEGCRQVGPTSQPHGRERGLSRSGPMGERGPVAE